jgi:hypothetical protein
METGAERMDAETPWYRNRLVAALWAAFELALP